HRVDDDRSCPKLLGAGAGVGDRRGAAHAGGLRRVDVEFVRMDHPDAVETPSGLVAIVHGRSPWRTLERRLAWNNRPSSLSPERRDEKRSALVAKNRARVAG